MRRSIVPIAAALLAVTTVPALAQDASTEPAVDGSAWVRVLHASPDEPAVDVVEDG